MIPGGIPLPEPSPEMLPQGIDKDWLVDLHCMLWELQNYGKFNHYPDTPEDEIFEEIAEYIERTVVRVKKQNIPLQ